MHVVDAARGVLHRHFERAEFAVVVLVIARHVDRPARCGIEVLRRPAQAFRVIVDVAGEHDEIRLGVRNRDRFVGFEMQVGQNANLHDGFLLGAARRSGQRTTLPGFIRFSGSSAALIVCISRTSTGDL